MKKILMTALAVSSATVVVPASAAVYVCSGANCTGVSENVLVDKNSVASSLVKGATQSGVKVEFTSSTDLLLGAANGQATIDAKDGLINNLTFSLLDGYSFGSAIFNLEAAPGKVKGEATSVTISYYDPVLKLFGTKSIKTNGQNFMGIYSDSGERFYGVTISGNPTNTGWGQLKQLRLGDVQGAVPEPATWAMMIVGFGAIGASMRRRRKADMGYSIA